MLEIQALDRREEFWVQKESKIMERRNSSHTSMIMRQSVVQPVPNVKLALPTLEACEPMLPQQTERSREVRELENPKIGRKRLEKTLCSGLYKDRIFIMGINLC